MSDSIERRFWKKVRITPGCWTWTAALNNYGYGAIGSGGRGGPTLGSHRVSWEIHNGPIPYNFHVLHKCDNPKCVNPDHLFLGTHAENMADRDAKGRQSRTMGSAHGRAKLTEAQVLAIREDSRLHREISIEYGIDKAVVSRIKRRKLWAHI